MKVFLATILTAYLLIAQGIPSIGGLGMVHATAAAPTVIGPVDSFINCNTSSPGTTLTVVILNACTLGNANMAGWALSTTPITGMTIAAHQTGLTLLGSTGVDGTAYATSTTSQSMAFDHTNASRTVIISFPSGVTSATWAGWIKLGPGTSGSLALFDYVSIQAASTGYPATIQLLTNTGSVYTAAIEYGQGGGVGHTTAQALTVQGTYWFSLNVDAVAGTSTMSIFNTAGTQVGSTQVGTYTTGEFLGSIRIGNNETGTAAGTSSFIENQMIRYSAAPPLPLGPINTTQTTVFWVGQSHNNKTSAGTTVATTKVLEEHSGDAVVVTCSNENASGQTTGVTNTAGETFTAAAAVKSAANAQSISQWATFPSSGHASQLYTCTFPSSSFSNVDAQIISGATAYDTGAVGNKASGADIASGSFTPSTATGSNVQCSYVQAGQAITPGTNYTILRSSSVDSMGCQWRGSAPNSSQTGTGIHSNTSASMTVVGNYRP